MGKAKVKKEIFKITEQIKDKYNPEKIILFGSWAYGQPNSSSDIDMLIIKKSNKRRVDRIRDLLLAIDYNVSFEPLVYTPQEIKERLELGDYFVEDIVKNGKVLYENKQQFT